MVVGGVLLASTVLGVVATSGYLRSEESLTVARAAFGEIGSELSPGGCLERVLTWRASCDAMKSLCDASSYRMMESCLLAKDRSTYCAEVGEATSHTSFGNEDCKSRGLDRDGRKACAACYRAIDAHCKRIHDDAGSSVEHARSSVAMEAG
jgi:hypothetical protein